MCKKFLILLIFIFSVINLPVVALTSAEEISQIEISVLDMNFPKESNQKRLDRIEKYVYGNISKKSEAQRIQRLKNDLGLPSFIDNNEQKIVQKDNSPIPAQNNSYNNKKPTQQIEKDKADYPAIDRLELAVLNKNYKNEDIYTRLNRLEMQVFKTTNNTSSLQDRVKALNTVVLNQKEFEQDVITPYDNMGQKRDSNFEIAVLEQQVFNQTFPNMSVDNRLSRLEEHLLKKRYTYDDEQTRIDRLGAVVAAQATSKNYDKNKFKQFLSTGVQVGSIILMILAMIL